MPRTTRERLRPVVFLALAFLLIDSAGAQEWTRFRGPNGAGRSETVLPAAFEGNQINWVTKLPGIGHSSPVIWGDKVFLLSADPKTATRYVVCVDTKGMRNYRDDRLMSFDALVERGRVWRKDHPGADEALDAEIDLAKPDDVAIMVYTSGTTCPPKGSMLSHRNLVYAADRYAKATDLERPRFETICYLPLCHVAERCYSMVTQLVIGGIVNFAESIDTVAANVREIAPLSFVGVPRIYEKMQQNFMFRLGDSNWLQRKAADWSLKRGRVLSDRRQRGKAGLFDRAEYGLHWLLLFRNMQTCIPQVAWRLR